MIHLVVNAQEFGRAEHGDRDILLAHREGIVTSVSVSGDCPDLDRPRALLAEAPRLGVGLSLALTGGTAVAEAAHVPSLIATAGATAGTTRPTPAAFAVDWLKGAILPLDVEREMEAQIERARSAGLTIDHLGTRGHLGFLPGVGQIVERVARRHKIAGIRSTVEPPTLSWLTDPRRGLQTGVLAGLSWLTRRGLGPLRHGPRTWGYLESGRLDEVRIVEIIGRLTAGAHELLCHPQAHPEIEGLSSTLGARSGELRALTSGKVKNALQSRGIVLGRWQDLF